MNRFSFDREGSSNDAVDSQVTLARSSRSDANSFIGHAHVQAFSVGFGIDRNRLYAQLAARANNANGDLTTIGDKDFAKHDSLAADDADLKRIDYSGFEIRIHPRSSAAQTTTEFAG